MKNHGIIDVQCTVIRSEKVQQPSRYWGVCAAFVAAACAGGAGLGLWSGSAAVAGLVGVALVLLLVGVNLKGQRPSQIWALTALVGIAGVALTVSHINTACSLFGLCLAGLAMLVLSKIEQRGWTYE